MMAKARSLSPTPLMAPVVASLVPTSAALGSPDFTLHVIGTGFAADDQILWNGSPEPTTFVSATELTTGVNMATAEVAMAIPVAVQNAAAEVSNVLTFELREAGTQPPLPDIDVPEGFAAVKDPWGRPGLLRIEEVAMVEEEIAVNDQKGPLWAQSPAMAYRRLTLRGGVQFYTASKSLTPLLAALKS